MRDKHAGGKWEKDAGKVLCQVGKEIATEIERDTIEAAKAATWQRAIDLLEKDFRIRKANGETVAIPGILLAMSILRLYADGREF